MNITSNTANRALDMSILITEHMFFNINICRSGMIQQDTSCNLGLLKLIASIVQHENAQVETWLGGIFERNYLLPVLCIKIAILASFNTHLISELLSAIPR